jgi:gamma-glutamylcyclotransferase (GGCT)/AIG2-like uncharacterized protein YtfP
MLEYVFVYGTLRKNEPNHTFMAGTELVSEQVSICGQLWDTGFGYPAVVLDQYSRVFGELYRVSVDQLQRLDRLEGYYGPTSVNHYTRIKQTVYTVDQSYSAYVYGYLQPPAEGVRIDSGDWKVEGRMIQSRWTYFAYGSCMDNRRFQQHGVDFLFQEVIGCGVLSNYEMKYTYKATDGRGRADIVESLGSRVEGKLYEIGQEAMEYLFEREGVSGKVYRPTVVAVEHNSLLIPNVITFMVVDKQLEEVPPPDWYLEEILRGAEGLVTDEYFQKLRVKGKMETL